MDTKLGESPKRRALLPIIVNAALMLAGIFNLGWGCFQAFIENESMAITCLTAGLLLLLASTIDRFELLKGFGIEAKTRALDKALSDAGATLDQLRHLAEITSRSIVSLTCGAGRVGSAPSIRSNAAMVQEVRETLRALSTKPETVRDTLKPWVHVTLFDGMEAIARKLRAELVSVAQEANQKAMALNEPRSSADQAIYEQLIARANAASEFNRLRVGTTGAWSQERVHERFVEIVMDMPVLTEENRLAFRREVDTWGPRFAYLVTNQELLDPEAWFAISHK